MPIDPDRIGSTRPYLIVEDRFCVSCRYNLKGLMTSGNCPECGRPIIKRRKDIPRYSDNLVNAPMRWLLTFGFGCTLAFLCALGVVAGGGLLLGFVLVQGGVKSPLAAAPAILCAVGWWLAVLLVTRPRPVTRGTAVDPVVEWRAFRWTARITQAFWVATGAVLALLIRDLAAGNVAIPFLSAGALVCFVVAALGLIPFLIYVSNLAFWATDASLGHGLRVCAWMIGFAAFLAVVTVIDVMTRVIPLGGLLRTLLFALDYVFMLAPVLYLLYCLWGLQSMGRWSVKNHVTAEARDDRLRERAARAAEMEKPMTSKVPEEASIKLDTEEKVFAYGEIKEQPSSPGYVVKKHEKGLKPYDVDPDRPNPS